MIKVLFKQNQKEQFTLLKTEGHAHLDIDGKDILCSAVSVLTENLSNCLKALLNLPVTIEEAKGLYSIYIESEFVCDESDLLFASVIFGLRVLAKQYPDRISVEEIK